MEAVKKNIGVVDYNDGMDLLQYKLNALAEDTVKLMNAYIAKVDEQTRIYMTKAKLVDAIMTVIYTKSSLQ